LVAPNSLLCSFLAADISLSLTRLAQTRGRGRRGARER
jgi:hypothetical protein